MFFARLGGGEEVLGGSIGWVGRLRELCDGMRCDRARDKGVFVREGASPGVVVSGEFEAVGKVFGISRRWYSSWEAMRSGVFRCVSVADGSLEDAEAQVLSIRQLARRWGAICSF